MPHGHDAWTLLNIYVPGQRTSAVTRLYRAAENCTMAEEDLKFCQRSLNDTLALHNDQELRTEQ